ncbi:MAG: aminomethyl-transferring glycine dehydrogenase [Acidobacteria bacterium]|nr:aminomethyl-transferring glycine dehydrogenase [Acidobacteriota bacterium]
MTVQQPSASNRAAVEGDRDFFPQRHIGPRPADRDAMLRAIGVSSLDELIDQTIPAGIRSSRELSLPDPEPEHAFLERLREVAQQNRVCRSFIGMGYYDCIVPSVIQRMVLENPGWYTPYTPYQAEVAQGRLESLLNFQTMVRDLTGMEVANASLLDEATAAAEAMTMLWRVQSRGAAETRRAFLVSTRCFPQTVEVVRNRAEPLGIELRVRDVGRPALDGTEGAFGLLLQYPDDDGAVADLRPLIEAAHEAGLLVVVASDLLALTLLTPPGEMGADVVVGNSQRFGVPLAYGGPHAAFFATREKFIRQAPGRIIGVSVDAHGRTAYRMAIQTREQHIRRERATSNICTAQALLANMAAMYSVYHGPDGLTAIARRVHRLSCLLDRTLRRLGYGQLNAQYFDTLKIDPGDSTGLETDRVRMRAAEAGLNFRYFSNGSIGVSLDETTTTSDVTAIVSIFAAAKERPSSIAELDEGVETPPLPVELARTSKFLTHSVFNSHGSETQMMRYIRGLERKDLGLDTSMIPLGSCTMKLNAATEMMPVTWPEFSRMHPFAPPDQAQGYRQVFRELEAALAAITGLPVVSLQPNSGAQGELAGLLVIRAHHRERGQPQRNVVLIPSSAHGTNPASAAMAGLQVVVVACDAGGNVDLGDLREKAVAHRDRLAALMITYPSTHGVYESGIREICEVVHEHGGQIYMDGANLNAQVGLTSPAAIGADVCHLNLHKTFSIPHGGGGPGMGPIAVARHLAPYLPGHPLLRVGGKRAIPAVAAAPWGSASILLISYAYIRLLGASGCADATRYAILNANYLKARLEPYYPVLYAGAKGRVAHELIFDLRAFKAIGIDEQDVAKRLMDYGFHAPTVSFPVAGTLMVEPTESEAKDELDKFCDAMIAIRQEIQDVIDGKADQRDNVLRNAPHTAAEAVSDGWSHPYSRERAVYPLPFVRARKFWPSVGRIDNPYGDRNLFCACPPLEVADKPAGRREK